jgi:hypothetical protein
MQSKFQRWWLYSCFAAVLLAGWAGGFSVIVTAVFIVIYLVGVALIGADDEVTEDPEPSDEAAEPADDNSQTEPNVSAT